MNEPKPAAPADLPGVPPSPDPLGDATSRPELLDASAPQPSPLEASRPASTSDASPAAANDDADDPGGPSPTVLAAPEYGLTQSTPS